MLRMGRILASLLGIIAIASCAPINSNQGTAASGTSPVPAGSPAPVTSLETLLAACASGASAEVQLKHSLSISGFTGTMPKGCQIRLSRGSILSILNSNITTAGLKIVTDRSDAVAGPPAALVVDGSNLHSDSGAFGAQLAHGGDLITVHDSQLDFAAMVLLVAAGPVDVSDSTVKSAGAHTGGIVVASEASGVFARDSFSTIFTGQKALLSAPTCVSTGTTGAVVNCVGAPPVQPTPSPTR